MSVCPHCGSANLPRERRHPSGSWGREVTPEEIARYRTPIPGPPPVPWFCLHVWHDAPEALRPWIENAQMALDLVRDFPGTPGQWVAWHEKRARVR